MDIELSEVAKRPYRHFLNWRTMQHPTVVSTKGPTIDSGRLGQFPRGFKSSVRLTRLPILW